MAASTSGQERLGRRYDMPTLPRFESGLAEGAIVACYLSAAIALLVLAVTQVGTVMSSPFKDFVFAVGKAWIPNAQAIGPYSGKETFMLVGWLASWAALHMALKGKDFSIRRTFGVALLITALATVLMWPPVWHLIE